MNNDDQLFADHEIKALSDVETKLILTAQSGGMQSLQDFWKAKRSVEADRFDELAAKALISINAKPVKKKWFQKVVTFFNSHMKRV